jgi:hypothetical protein
MATLLWFWNGALRFRNIALPRHIEYGIQDSNDIWYE